MNSAMNDIWKSLTEKTYYFSSTQIHIITPTPAQIVGSIGANVLVHIYKMNNTLPQMKIPISIERRSVSESEREWARMKERVSEKWKSITKKNQVLSENVLLRTSVKIKLQNRKAKEIKNKKHEIHSALKYIHQTKNKTNNKKSNFFFVCSVQNSAKIIFVVFFLFLLLLIHFSLVCLRVNNFLHLIFCCHHYSCAVCWNEIVFRERKKRMEEKFRNR